MDPRHLEDFALTFLDTLTKRPPSPIQAYAAFDETLALLETLRETPLPREVAGCVGELFARLQPVDVGRALPRYLAYLEQHAASCPQEAAALAVAALKTVGEHDPVDEAQIARALALVGKAGPVPQAEQWRRALQSQTAAA